tara:strand:+ start:478 stop:1977 length:1500 start_codon:yes stop_codon:yes gene_type:complete
MSKQSKFRYTPGKATDITEIMPVLREDFKQNSSPIRKQADRLLNHTVRVEQLIEDGAVASVSVGDMMIQLGADISDGTTPLADNPLIRGNFDKCKREAKKLFNTSFFRGKQFGHDFSVVAIRLGVFAQVLQDLEDAIVKAAGAGGGVKVGTSSKEFTGLFDNPLNRRNKTVDAKDPNNKGATKTQFEQKATLSGLRKVKKRIQTMFLGARKLDRINPFKGDIASKYTKLADEMNTIQDFQMELTAEKKKLFDITSGKASLGLTVVQKNKNQFDAILEAAFGRNMNKEFTTGTEDNMKDYFLNKVDIGDVKGGPETLNNKITKDLGLLLGGKTPKKASNTSKTTESFKLTKGRKKNNVVGAAARSKAGADYAKKALAIATIKRKTDKKESGNSSEFKQLAELRLKIQARLPAEVRRNMGGTALTNRTSRFSNSVHLTKLLNTPKGIVGDYSYMLSPYETFENTGARKWKTGYNPKPLIAKSIRNLAFEIAGARFIKGRRT